MFKHGRQIQRLMFLFAIAGLFAVSADFACLDDVCADSQTGAYRTMGDIMNERIRTLDEALKANGVVLSTSQKETLEREGALFGVVKLDRPVKHPNGKVEMPARWLAPVPQDHPWSKHLGPADDAFYSFVEERIFRAKLFDPANPTHLEYARAYLEKVNSAAPGNEFLGWTAESRTECEKIKLDARGTGATDAM
jgi:hypothetical protein